MIRKIGITSAAILSGCLLISTVYPCGLEYSFRAYLDKRFWQPIVRYEDTLRKSTAVKQSPPLSPKAGTLAVFAGFSTDSASPSLMDVRASYAKEAFQEAAERIEKAQGLLAGKELEELRLLQAKTEMRLVEQAQGDDREALIRARQKFEFFLETSQDPAWRSEAGGWIAHIHCLLGEYPPAAKFYIDELGNKDTVFPRESLLNSLHTIFPYNGSNANLSEHLEEYFDTPAHALFIVYIVTNPVYGEGPERKAMATVAQTVIRSLKRHNDLFNGAGDSDLLALALMRASLYMGDIPAALAYSGKLAPSSGIFQSSEFNWMAAICRFLEKDYAGAEPHLIKVLSSGEATSYERAQAAKGLVGVYQKLGGGADQLHAAFLYEKELARRYADEKEGKEDTSTPSGMAKYCAHIEWGTLFDIPYLLDIQLSEQELENYLTRYEKEARETPYPVYSVRCRNAYEAVEYALAVRSARQEKYEAAAEIFDRLHAGERSEWMRNLSALYQKVSDTTLSTEALLAAKYDYAAFLEAHSTKVFYNDMIWGGYQTWAFMTNPNVESLGYTSEERTGFQQIERKLQDDQEERWRAYQILSSIMEQAGHSDIGRKAAVKALRCLDFINTDRFGRKEEIAQAKSQLLAWLKTTS